MSLSFILITTALVCILIYVIGKYLHRLHWWHRQNVDTANPFLLMTRTYSTHLYKAIHEMYVDMCRNNKPCQVIETLVTTSLVVQDHMAIQDILIGQFENFNERGFYVNAKDPLVSNLGRIEYAFWKPMRRTYASSLTAAKVKEYFPLFQKLGNEMLTVFDTTLKDAQGEIEVYDLYQRYAIDLIANVGFALQFNCLKNPKTLLKQRVMKAVRESIRPFFDQFKKRFSKILEILNIQYHSKGTIEFFLNIMNESLKLRSNCKRSDFIENLIESKNDGDLKMNDDLMLDQVFGFFTAGFDNTSTAMTYSLYELTKNPEIQEKARSEILTVMASHGNEITYEGLKEMTYTYQVIQETLRKYPVGHMLPRTCPKPTKIRTTQGDIEIPANTTIIIPTYGIHHNPQFYPEPENFRPERFEEREIAKRPPCSFLSFGDGPKVCVAMQFTRANMVYQLALILSHYRLALSQRTPKELKFDKTRMFTLSPGCEIFIKIESI